MSNIFDLFGTTGSNTLGHQLKNNTSRTSVNLMRSRTLSDNGGISLKNAVASAGTKPKGLSLRQTSDPNICNSNFKKIENKGITSLMKPTLKITINDTNTFTSCNDKEKVAKTIRGKQRKGLSPVTKSPHSKFTAQKPTDEFKFKKPLVPRQITKSFDIYPEPEKLSYDYDQKQYDRLSLDNLLLGKPFTDSIIPVKKIIPFEDEGFISDPETLNIPSLPTVDFQSDYEYDIYDDDAVTAPEFPVISDDDDDYGF